MISPVPSGLVKKSASPGRAPFFGQIASGRTVPTTARPYFGSASRIVWPPASSPPAARTCRSAAAKISASISIGSSSGKAAREQRRAAHREDVVECVRGRDRAVIGGVVDDGREEIEREDQRPLVIEPVDGGIVGRGEADEEVIGLRWDEAREQLLETRGRILGRAASAGGEVGELYGSGVQVHGGVSLKSVSGTVGGVRAFVHVRRTVHSYSRAGKGDDGRSRRHLGERRSLSFLPRPVRADRLDSSHSRCSRIAAASSASETEPSNFAFTRPSRPTRKTHGSLLRPHCNIQRL